MNKVVHGAIGFLTLVIFTACTSHESPRSTLTREELESLSQAKGASQARDLAEAVATGKKRPNDKVALYREGLETIFLPPLEAHLDFSKKRAATSLDSLKGYISQFRKEFGISANISMGLQIRQVSPMGDRFAVHVDQSVQRSILNQPYRVPILGAGFVAIIKKNRLVSVQSTLVDPPDLSFISSEPGIDLAGFSEKQMSVLLSHFQSAERLEKIKTEMEKLGRENGRPFDFVNFEKVSAGEKVTLLKDFFATLSARSTARVLIDLARQGRLSLVRYGKDWLIQVSQLFDLPLEFDLAIPESNEKEKIKARNLRSLNQHYAYLLYSEPNHPDLPRKMVAEVENENQELDRGNPYYQTARIFQELYKYFDRNFGWKGYSGNGAEGGMFVVVDVRTPDVIQNAHWDPQLKKIVIGAGGDRLTNFKNSPSVLGHEFAHAIISRTSNLIYSNESGALNEHFADVQGVSFEAAFRNQDFSFLVGEDIIPSETAELRLAALRVAMQLKGYKEDTIKALYLDRYALRNMMAPAFGLSSQIETYDQALKKYGPACQPSEDNDRCGVHDQSGVVNKAAALIIRHLGVERSRSLFFRTLAFRLGPRSNFAEYARQMIEECRESDTLFETDCNLIATAFDVVGLKVPTPGPVVVNAPAPSAPTPRPQNPGPAPAPNTNSPNYCGWVSVSPARNVTIIDNKYDAVALVKGNALTRGDFSDLYNFKCACVQSVIGKTTNSKGVPFNYFVEVQKTRDLDPKACRNIVFK